MDGVAGFETAQRVDEQRHAGQLHHLLGAVGLHARADAGGGDDGDVQPAVAHCVAVEVWRGLGAGRPSSLKRPKIILPAVVCNTLVTDTSMFLPIMRRALSTTTMVPSSR